MSGIRNLEERKWYSFTGKELIKALIIAAVIYLIVFVIADNSWPRRYFASDIKISRATVIECQTEDGKYYLRVGINDSSVQLPSDELWFEVKPDFYNSHNINSQVGISLVKYDSYKKNLIGAGRSYDSTKWEAQEIYNTYEIAQQENQYKKYGGEAVLEKKQQSQNGQKSFVLKADERSFSTNVDDSTYSKYSQNDKVKCTFEAVGEFVKLVSIDN